MTVIPPETEEVGTAITRIINESCLQDIPDAVKTYIIPLLISTFFSPSINPRSSKEVREKLQQFQTNIQHGGNDKENMVAKYVRKIDWVKIQQTVERMVRANSVVALAGFKVSLERKKKLIKFMVKKAYSCNIQRILYKFYENKRRNELKIQFPKSLDCLSQRKLKQSFNLLQRKCNRSCPCLIEDYKQKELTLYRKGCKIVQMQLNRTLRSVLNKIKAGNFWVNRWRSKWVQAAACNSPLTIQGSLWRMLRYAGNYQNESQAMAGKQPKDQQFVLTFVQEELSVLITKIVDEEYSKDICDMDAESSAEFMQKQKQNKASIVWTVISNFYELKIMEIKMGCFDTLDSPPPVLPPRQCVNFDQQSMSKFNQSSDFRNPINDDDQQASSPKIKRLLSQIMEVSFENGSEVNSSLTDE